MNMRWMGGIYLFCSSLMLAQQGSANRQITLDVVVADKSGKPVGGLQQADFTLLDNKQPQKITSFQAVEGGTAAAAEPMEAVLLVDEVNASFMNVASERDAIEKFLGRNGGQLALPVSMVFFSDHGITDSEAPSRDGNALIAKLNGSEFGLRTSRRSQGFYGAEERLNLSLQKLAEFAEREAAKPGRKLVVWISPGWPLLSGPGVQMTSQAQRSIFDSIVVLSDRLRGARITLYVVDPLGMSDAAGLRTALYKQFLKPVTKVSRAVPGDVGLQVLASQSGGLVLNSSNDVAGEIEKCVADASSFYVLTFDGLPGDGPDEFHAIELKIGKPGLAARTRAGYYAQPEPAPTH
ncbi:MAG: VWA domain-containing protein [Bryobacteraceae bacterium]